MSAAWGKVDFGILPVRTQAGVERSAAPGFPRQLRITVSSVGYAVRTIPHHGGPQRITEKSSWAASRDVPVAAFRATQHQHLFQNEISGGTGVSPVIYSVLK